MTGVEAVTAVVEIEKATEDSPGPIVMDFGITAEVLELLRVTIVFLATAPERIMFPVELTPPVTATGLTNTLVRVTGITVRVVVFETDAMLARMVAIDFLLTLDASTLNVVVVVPGATST